MSDQMKKCPYCAELIKAEAIKCRFCGSVITSAPASDPHAGHWHRVNNGKKIAGVCTGIAQEFNAPQAVLPLRIFFILSTFFYSFGLIFYVLLWILMPSPLDTVPTATAPLTPQDAGHNGGSVPPRKSNRSNPVLGLLLILAGVAFILFTLTRGHVPGFPIRSIFNHPTFLFNNIHLFPGLWVALILIGLFIVIFGTIKAFRNVLGCGLILLGTILLFMFIPVIPGILFVPGLLILGFIFLLIGMIKLLM